jgi:hypothetical protein
MSHALQSHALQSHALQSHALQSHALQSHALQSHALPNRVLLLINEYSRPMTKPDWRKSKPIITTFRLYLHVKYILFTPVISPTKRLHSMMLNNIGDTEWYNVYVYIRYHGLKTYLREYSDYNMLNADGIGWCNI